MDKHVGRETDKAGELPEDAGEAPRHGIVQPWQDKYTRQQGNYSLKWKKKYFSSILK